MSKQNSNPDASAAQAEGQAPDKTTEHAADPAATVGELPSHYVAIGASAGGLEAIEAFFSQMPAQNPFGFIVVQHLSPDHKSLMVEILSKRTGMPVRRAEDGMLVEPAHVYLIPPKKNLTIFHGRLLLSEQDPGRSINLPIDLFLRSLAEDQGEKAIAVILSGTGSDGTRGVREVKQFGGMIMVQDEQSARFDGMPRAAIATGLADFVLPPDEMPQQIRSFVKYPHITKARRSEIGIADENGLTRVFSLLRDRFKVDFTHYKPSTVSRRIERRMTVNQIAEIGDYVDFMQQHPAEISTLFRELLIGVTSFFRDQHVFERLELEVLPEIIGRSSERELRLWVPGCSTGEEAYTLAILCRVCMERLGVVRDVKVFATDLDREAIHFAALGSYPESVAADIPIEYLKRYFFRNGDHFRIARTIREMVVFAQHNIIKDPPFTNIDLISCRNLLIYLQPVLQNRIFEAFAFSLRNSGVLVLGTSESTGDMADQFEPIDSKLKIFRTKASSRALPRPHFSGTATDTRFRELRGQLAQSRRIGRLQDEQVLERFLDAVSGELLPTAVIVNEQLEVLHVVGNTGGFFRLPSGRPTYEIDKIAVKELAIPLTTGTQKVFRRHEPLRLSGIRVKDDGVERIVDLRIIPLAGSKTQTPMVAVLIEEVQPRPVTGEQTAVSYDVSQETEQRIQDLEQELQFSRENLQATIEELETSNEELQATNEELLASNEELQSTNEELQSTNEELHTVNAEYQNKIIELTELNNDVDNLLGASQIGMLLLDENLEVRRFSAQVTAVFRLLDGDIGRPIRHISHSVVDVDPIERMEEVAAGGNGGEWEILTGDDRWYLMRVTPYAVGPDDFSGVVAGFVEITGIKATERKLRESEELFASAINTSPALVWISGTDKLCTWFNQPWLQFTGRTLEQERGAGWTEGLHPEDRERCLAKYDGAFDRREEFSMEYRLRRHDGEYRWVLDAGHPRHNAAGEFIGYIGSCLDITERREHEEEIRQLLMEKDELLKGCCGDG